MSQPYIARSQPAHGSHEINTYQEPYAHPQVPREKSNPGTAPSMSTLPPLGMPIRRNPAAPSSDYSSTNTNTTTTWHTAASPVSPADSRSSHNDAVIQMLHTLSNRIDGLTRPPQYAE